jgi:hypothetical protein
MGETPQERLKAAKIHQIAIQEKLENFREKYDRSVI